MAVVERNAWVDDVTEVALGLLGNMMLRQPEVRRKVQEAWTGLNRFLGQQ